MAEPLSWRNLTIGLVGLASVAAAVLVILLFARVGGVRGPKVNIYVTAAEARGVLKGTNVMLSGNGLAPWRTSAFCHSTTTLWRDW
jgi:hypothetical protein